MKQVPLSELSQDELLKKAKALKAASANQGAMLVILAAASVYLTYLREFTAFTALPIAFLPMLLIHVSNLKKIQTEISYRNT